jgi:hypothetical protein
MADGETPVSWFLIEPGWEVVAADGTRVGKVAEKVGDSNVDIFDGLSVSPPGLASKNRYVPAEQVARIVPGKVVLTVSAADFERDAKFREPPPSEEIFPEKASLAGRVRRWFTGN